MTEIHKAYDPKQVEPKWREIWLSNNIFAGKIDKNRESYSIVIPPPNVTGILTMGHVLNNTIQDILARRARLKGKSVMWLPGTDHAGIATQTKVEKVLKKDEGKNRHDLGRQKFLQHVWKWKEKHGGIILDQLNKLGASCDWNRNVFTLDEKYSKAVLTAFVKLYERGYIYRGKRMVNWCPVSLTALSDEEVIMKPQKGIFYKMRYELVDTPGKYLEISTTRPETIMGDTAVAVNPEDNRYKQYIGQQIWRPFPKEKIPIIADEAVDQDFGTGVLKVTPAHDSMDFEIGIRHNLPVIDVFNPDATLNELAGEDFNGLDRFKARKLAVDKLDDLELLIDKEEYENNVGYSERGNVPIEPRISEQWFLKYPKVEEAKRVVKDGYIKFWPKRWEKTYLHWLDNIQDWCISRQLWWGHRIPVWYKKGCDRKIKSNWHISIDGPSDPENWEQDDDVLDTWASSWLWPFATMGWPESKEIKKLGLEYFYPTTDLVTGPDIIFFWVARMIMAGLEFMGEGTDLDIEDSKSPLTETDLNKRIPFRNVYFTGIIRDIKGRKMSKSLGNSPDPLDLIEKFGADGLRFGIMSIAPKGQDILFSDDRITLGRNFCNKLWNACRFRQMSGSMYDNSSIESIIQRIEPGCFDDYDHWILSRLIQLINDIDNAYNSYEFNLLTQLLHTFFWGDFCDWYVEVSKTKLQMESKIDNCLAIQDLIIRQVLMLINPITPHITDELWELLSYKNNEKTISSCEIESHQQLINSFLANDIILDAKSIKHVEYLKELVVNARSLKAANKLAGKNDVKFIIVPEKCNVSFIESNQETFQKLAGASSLCLQDKIEKEIPAAVTKLGTLYLDLAESIDTESEILRLKKELTKLEKIILAGENKLNDNKFINKAPVHIVEGAKKQHAEANLKYNEFKRLLENIN